MSDQISNKPKLTVPDGYFDFFAKRLQAQLELDQLLGEDTGSGFVVPEGYFKTNASNIINNNIQKSKIISLYVKRLVWAAASVAAIVVLVYSMQKNTSSELDFNTLSEFVTQDESNFSTEELASLLNDDEIGLLSQELLPDDESYLDYLDENTTAYDIYYE